VAARRSGDIKSKSQPTIRSLGRQNIRPRTVCVGSGVSLPIAPCGEDCARPRSGTTATGCEFDLSGRQNAYDINFSPSMSLLARFPLNVRQPVPHSPRGSGTFACECDSFNFVFYFILHLRAERRKGDLIAITVRPTRKFPSDMSLICCTCHIQWPLTVSRSPLIHPTGPNAFG
jgi:hypothetical protein